MQRAIYYPGFEVQDETWLKFALLYVDTLHPIIPPRAGHKRGDLFRYLRGETDLIHPHPPDKQTGLAATYDAIEQVERVLKRPQDFAPVFHNSNVTNKWKHSADWDYEIFHEKYSGAWASFCVQNGIGKKTHNGLIVETSLCLLFMSILADIISEVTQIPSLTDNPKMSDISILTRRAKPLAPQSVFIATSIIKLQLPCDLDEIPLEKIVNHRRRAGFKKKLHAFHAELERHINDVENGVATGDFFQTRGTAFKDFSDDLATLGAGLVQLGVGVATLLNGQDVESDAETWLADGSVLTTDSIISIRNTWNHSGNRRFTRKYLADLRLLGSN